MKKRMKSARPSAIIVYVMSEPWLFSVAEALTFCCPRSEVEFTPSGDDDVCITGAFMSAHCTLVVALTQRKRSGASQFSAHFSGVAFFAAAKTLLLAPTRCETLQKSAPHTAERVSGGVQCPSVCATLRHAYSFLPFGGNVGKCTAKHSEMHAHFSEREGEEKNRGR